MQGKVGSFSALMPEAREMADLYLRIREQHYYVLEIIAKGPEIGTECTCERRLVLDRGAGPIQSRSQQRTDP